MKVSARIMCTKASSAKQLVWNPRPRTNRQQTRRDASKNCLRLVIRIQDNNRDTIRGWSTSLFDEVDPNLPLLLLVATMRNLRHAILEIFGMFFGLLNDENTIMEEFASHTRWQHSHRGEMIIFACLDRIKFSPIGSTKLFFEEIYPIDFGYNPVGAYKQGKNMQLVVSFCWWLGWRKSQKSMQESFHTLVAFLLGLGEVEESGHSSCITLLLDMTSRIWVNSWRVSFQSIFNQFSILKM